MMKKVMSVAAALMVLASVSFGQGFCRFIYDVAFPLTVNCDGTGGGLPDGTPVYIYWDSNSNGVDLADPLACEVPPPCVVNYCSFFLNGEAQGLGAGYFIWDAQDFCSQGCLPEPASFYLVVRCTDGNWKWVSEVMTVESGPGDFEFSTWTCMDSACTILLPCLPPPAPTDLVVSTNRCDEVLLTWSYVPGVQGLDQFRIARDGNLIATVTDTSVRVYHDVTASGSNIQYAVTAHRNCDVLSAPAQGTGARLPLPPTPSNMTASDNWCDRVVLSWTYATNVGLERWVVTRNGVAIDSIPHNGQAPGPRSYVHVNAPVGEALYCVYGSSNACGWGTGACDNGQRLAGAPDQVQDVSATDGDCPSTTVTWTDVINESSYQVWRSNQDGSGAVNISGSLPPNTVIYADNGGTGGTIYRYWVVALNSCGAGPNSTYDLGSRGAIPPQVTGLTASDGTNCNAVVLNWANVIGETGFRIYRNSSLLDSVAADVLTYDDTNAPPGTTFTYRVAAFNACGSSALSAADTGYRGLVPDQVTNVQASDGTDCDLVILHWANVNREAGFRILRNVVVLDSVAADVLTYNDATAQPGTRYSYLLVAFNTCGNGLYSAANTGFRGLPGQVNNVQASDARCDSIVVTWDLEWGAALYRVRQEGNDIGTTTATRFAHQPPPGTYAYTVTAESPCGVGAESDPDDGTRSGGGQSCVPTPEVVFAGYLWMYVCASTCNGFVMPIRVFPAPGDPPDPLNPPLVRVEPGCYSEEGCTPADFVYNYDSWVYDPVTECWINSVLGLTDCACIWVYEDFYLPVGFNHDFAAIPGDGTVRLTWSTSSESNLSHFEILRDGSALANVDASNSATGHAYSFVDRSVQNGATYHYRLGVYDLDGTFRDLASVEATPRAPLITDYALYQNYPNPFNPETQITFDLVEAGFVSLKMFDVMGHQIAEAVNGTESAGRHTVLFNGADLPSGMYLCKLEVNGFRATQKMVLLK
jgi:hypothetical protein